ncbi:MAG TPA: transcriptional repressor LexA [Geminicoccaceae bacterium]|nr:transcriptional repressor LexA [Geminicoccaceae bacterium]
MLTQRQHELLNFIHRYFNEHGVPPSFEEMRDALKLRSKSGIHRLITGLEERGYIRRLPYRARALEVVRLPQQAWPAARRAGDPAGMGGAPWREGGELGPNVVRGRFSPGSAAFPGRSVDGDDAAESGRNGTVTLPLLGRIAAGTPIEALRDPTNTVEVPAGLLRTGEHYALEVVGDSMIGAGIHDGDTVVVQRADTADNGTIVVALIDDQEVTLKRLRQKGASIALEAANPDYETRIFGPSRVKLQGRLVGLIRRY